MGSPATVAAGRRAANNPDMSRVALPVIMPSIAGQAWSCRSCARCCYDLVGHISGAERERIDRQGWSKRLGVAPYVRIGSSIVLNKHEDGACVFLDRQTRLCRIHAEFGEADKPVACRIYPFTVRPVAGGWQASLRFDCPSVAESHGEALFKHRTWLTALTSELPPMAAPAFDQPLLHGNVRLDEEATRRIGEKLSSLVEATDQPMRRRVEMLTWVASELAGARLDRVGADRVESLVAMLVRAAPGMTSRRSESPSPRHAAMLRELVFVHAEHVTIAQMTENWGRKLVRRGAQLRQAWAMRRGRGRIPAVRGLPTNITFDDVDQIEAAQKADQVARIDDLLRRYLLHRFQTRTCYGPGYYDWPLVEGLLALCASLAVVGWLSRAYAAAAGRSELTMDDVVEGLRIMDRSAGLSPALNTRAERLRLGYLCHDAGLIRLVTRWSLCRNR